MIVQIPNVLSAELVQHFRQQLLQASWLDGKTTAGYQAVQVKNNMQLADDSAEAQALGQMIVQALESNSLFVSAALPQRILPPKFNCYTQGQAYGTHVDSAIMQAPNLRLRTDLSATLFLTDPHEYDGGELVIEDTYGVHSIKLAAGDVVVYPASSRHRVAPVTRGARISSFFWVQSMVRDEGERRVLFQLDNSVQQLMRELGSAHLQCQELAGVYHNLLRRWAQL